jgi:hypothetical protein
VLGVPAKFNFFHVVPSSPSSSAPSSSSTSALPGHEQGGRFRQHVHGSGGGEI